MAPCVNSSNLWLVCKLAITKRKKISKKSDSQRQQFCIFYVRIPRGRNRGIFQYLAVYQINVSFKSLLEID